MFVKICGITNEEDALLAVALGADCLGFNFVPGSPRRISPNDAHGIRRRLPHGTVTVGVFKNEPPEKIVSIVTECGLSGAQLHGREPVSEVRWIRKRLPFVIQAFVADDPQLENASTTPADIVLLDASTPGSGNVFDWRLASAAPSNKRIMIAGGLNPDNVADAISQLNPYGVDVATGVESSPGKKDAKKMQLFIDIAKDLSSPQDLNNATITVKQFNQDQPEKQNDNISAPFDSLIYDWMDDGE